MSVSITDCTIRDGGYLLNKNSDSKFVKEILKGLCEAGIDFVETGFLQNECNGESIVYRNSTDIEKYLPEDKKNTEFLGFCDNSRYSPEKLDEYTGRSFKWLRISFAWNEIDSALDFCARAQGKGYYVQFNPMDTVSYSDEELIKLIEKVNLIRPASFSIVDTFGAMYMNDLTHMFKLVNDNLDESIKIGLHSHDNLGLSCALAERMIELSEENKRDIIVDGSLYGMGRGAGNAKTELLADYINKHCGKNYNIAKILELIDKFISPIADTVHWGYDLPMYICGTKHSHVDNVYHLSKEYDISINDMYGVIDSLEPSRRIRYGTGYSKSDFSELDKVYRNYMKGK